MSSNPRFVTFEQWKANYAKVLFRKVGLRPEAFPQLEADLNVAFIAGETPGAFFERVVLAELHDMGHDALEDAVDASISRSLVEQYLEATGDSF